MYTQPELFPTKPYTTGRLRRLAAELRPLLALLASALVALWDELVWPLLRIGALAALRSLEEAVRNQASPAAPPAAPPAAELRDLSRAQLQAMAGTRRNLSKSELIARIQNQPA